MKTIKTLLLTAISIPSFLWAEGIMLNYNYRTKENPTDRSSLIVYIQALQRLHRLSTKKNAAQRLLQRAIDERAQAPRTPVQTKKSTGLTQSNVQAQKKLLKR